jgi:FkbM family methyltransferase
MLSVGEARLVSTLDKLRGSTEPIVLYGAGATARRVYEYLSDHGIPLYAVAVDRPQTPEARFGGHRLLSLDQLASENRSFQFVLGFVPVADDADTIRRRLAGKVPGSLSELDFSALSFGAASPEFVESHASQLRTFSDWLADDLSRQTLVGYVQARLSLDAGCVADLYRGHQYFPPDIVTLQDAEHFVDAGAYDGDTIAQFAERTGGRHASIVAFEPDATNFRKLQERVARLHLQNCDLRNTGTSDSTGELRFRGGDAFLSKLDAEGDVLMPVEAIDDVVGDRPVSFIKMDVEGAELASLVGARRTIERHRPRLAICLYHKLEDLITIPAWIRNVLPDSRLSLRVHTRHSQELVLYAVP